MTKQLTATKLRNLVKELSATIDHNDPFLQSLFEVSAQDYFITKSYEEIQQLLKISCDRIQILNVAKLLLLAALKSD